MQKLLADFHINPYFSGLCIINLIMYKSLIVKSTSCKSSLNALHMVLTQNSKYISNYFIGRISEMQRFFTGGPRQGFKSFGLLYPVSGKPLGNYVKYTGVLFWVIVVLPKDCTR